MASPFALFRKHQKILIAVLGLMAMFAFVILPEAMKNLDSGDSRDPLVVRTSEYGNLHQSELRFLLWQRRTVLTFLAQALQLAYDRPISPEAVESVIGPPTEQSMLDTWLLARRAEELGMVVNDGMINEYIKEQTLDRVTSKQIKNILKSRKISQRALFDALRIELLARQLQRTFVVSMQGAPPPQQVDIVTAMSYMPFAAAPPAQRWDYYRRLNSRAMVEVVPVPVAAFAGEKIAEPDEAELLDFFDRYKENDYDPASPEPGFHQPHKIAIEYFKAEYAKFINPDELIEQRQPAPKKKKDEKEPPATKAAATKEQPKEAAPSEPAAETSPEKDEKPTPPKPAKGEPAGKPDAAPKDTDGTSSRRAASPFRFVSLMEEETKEEETAPSEEAAEPKEKPAAEPKGKPAAEAEEKPPAEAEEKPAEPEPAKEAPAASQEPAEPAAAKDEEGAAAEEKEDQPAESLDEAMARLREQLAGPKENPRIRKILDSLRDRMDQYDRELSLFTLKRSSAEPKKLNFPKLAQQNGLTAHETGLVSALEAREFDIAASAIDGNWQYPFLSYVFETLPEHRPAISRDRENNYYLFWKSKDIRERVPEFEDEGIRKQVVHWWKMVRARSLAEQSAEQLAAEARKAKKSLAQLFANQPGKRVVKTEPFSWMTFGSTRPMMSERSLRISQVDGVDVPGHDFMRTVFEMKPGQVAVAMNQPKTAAYVIRMIEMNPPPGALRVQFESDAYDKYAAVGSSDQRAIYEAWLKEIKSAAGFHLERELDRRSVE